VTHVVEQGGDTHTRCGIKVKDDAALPLVAAWAVQMHVDGRGMTVCPRCGGILETDRGDDVGVRKPEQPELF
jgi:hypothetical protein